MLSNEYRPGHRIEQGDQSAPGTAAFAARRRSSRATLRAMHIDSATATYACVNGRGNHPKARNKQSVTTSLTTTGSFPVRNGQTTGSISAGPPAAGPFFPPCNPPMTVVLVQVSYWVLS